MVLRSLRASLAIQHRRNDPKMVGRLQRVSTPGRQFGTEKVPEGISMPAPSIPATAMPATAMPATLTRRNLLGRIGYIAGAGAVAATMQGLGLFGAGAANAQALPDLPADFGAGGHVHRPRRRHRRAGRGA